MTADPKHSNILRWFVEGGDLMEMLVQIFWLAPSLGRTALVPNHSVDLTMLETVRTNMLRQLPNPRRYDITRSPSKLYVHPAALTHTCFQNLVSNAAQSPQREPPHI